MSVEKIIHQSWKTKEMDEVMAEWTSSVKATFPTYEYKFWTDDDNDSFVKTHYPHFYDFYKNVLIPIERCDFVRYLYIYHYGGMYIDLDTKMQRPLELSGSSAYLIDQTKEANVDRWPFLLDCFFVAGEKHSPFFYDLCQNIHRGTVYRLLSQSCRKEYYQSLYRTGPFMLTKFYLLNIGKYKVDILKDVFTTRRSEKDVKPKDQYHGVHMQWNTWMKPEDRMR